MMRIFVIFAITKSQRQTRKCSGVQSLDYLACIYGCNICIIRSVEVYFYIFTHLLTISSLRANNIICSTCISHFTSKVAHGLQGTVRNDPVCYAFYW